VPNVHGVMRPDLMRTKENMPAKGPKHVTLSETGFPGRGEE
jgi:hypothetical protein